MQCTGAFSGWLLLLAYYPQWCCTGILAGSYALQVVKGAGDFLYRHVLQVAAMTLMCGYSFHPHSHPAWCAA